MNDWFRRIINSKSKTFLTLCFCFIAGSGLASLVVFPHGAAFYLYLQLFVITAILILFWNKKIIRFFIFFVLFFVFGVWRYSITLPNCANPGELCFYDGETRSFEGIVADEPAQKVDSVSYIIRTESPRGRVLVRAPLYPNYNYGDRLIIDCRLLDPRNLHVEFRYDKYLVRRGVWSVCSYPDIEKVGDGGGNLLLSQIFLFKSKLNDQLSRLWPEPENSLMSGLLYGARTGLPRSIQENFNNTGVSHIVAVSGFNISIIIAVVMSAMIYLGLHRQRAFYFVFAGTILFVIFTGLSASALRAAFMGLAVLTARQMGRGSQVLNVFVFTVASMQLLNPYLLIWDVGFQLSFLALLGLVYVAPVFPKKIPAVLSSTLSAIIATFPLILYQFGNFSFVAPLTNLLILWIIPWLMLFGVIAVAASIIYFPVGQLVAYIAHFGLAYVIMVVRFFGERDWSHATMPIPIWVMFGMYGVIIFVIARSHRATKQSSP